MLPTFRERLAGQRFERCLCAVPRRVEVAAIKRHQRACGFQDRVRLIRQPLTAGVLSAPQTAENAGNRTGQVALRVEF
jgi:hypothetical protein